MNEIIETIRSFFDSVEFGALDPSVFTSGGFDASAFDPRAWLGVGGLILLLFGRRLYALVLGVAGFAFGWSLAPAFEIGPPSAQLAAGLILGVFAAMLALFVQRLILNVAGFILGVTLAWWAVSVGGVSMGGIELLVILLSGFLCAFLLRALFGAALVVLSSLVGSSLLIQASGITGPLALVGWFCVALFGILLQTRNRGESKDRRKRERKRRRKDERKRRGEEFGPA